MAADFPASKKTFTQVVDGTDYTEATQVNQAYDEVEAVETLIGALGRSQSYNTSIKALLKNFCIGCNVIYKSATELTVKAGEIYIPDDSGNGSLRQNTSDTTVTWAMIDTGVEENSTTYYVYARADSAATTFTILISKSATSPSGATYYRKIGSFYNNSSGDMVAPIGFTNSAHGFSGGNIGPYNIGEYYYLTIGKNSSGILQIISGYAATGTAIPLPGDCVQADCQWIVSVKYCEANTAAWFGYDIAIDANRIVTISSKSNNWVG